MSTLQKALARKLKLNTGLEDDSINVEITTAVDEDKAASDAAVVEIQDAEVEVQETESDMDDVEEKFEGIESLMSSLESLIEEHGEGAITPPVATIVKTATGIALKEDKVSDLVDEIIPSTESFNDDRVGSATVSMENLGQTLKALAVSLMNTIKRVMEAVVEMFTKIVDGSGRVSKTAKTISEEAAKLDSAETNSVKSSALKSLTINGNIPTGGNMVTSYAYVSTVVDSFMKDPAKATAFIDSLVTVIKLGGNDKDVANKFSDSVSAQHAMLTEKHETVDGVELYRTPQMLGNYAVIAAKDFSALEKAVKFCVPKVEKVSDGKPTELKAKPLSGSEITALCDTTQELMTKVGELRKHTDARRKLRAAADKGLQKLAKNEDKAARKYMLTLANYSTALLRSDRAFAGYAIRTASAMNSYCADCVKAHKAAGKKADK